MKYTTPIREDLVSFAKEALDLPPSTRGNLTALSGRGSDRAYFRFEWGQAQSAILAHYESGRIENSYFVGIAQFLIEADVPVPRIIRHDASKKLILMQDLGNIDLWTLRNAPWKVRESFYRLALTAVYRLHSMPATRLHPERVKLMEPFGPSLYQWEKNYFKEHFVKAVCNIDLEPDFAKRLDNELDCLAQRLLAGERCLIHRDLQSQNVIIFQDQAYLIDFQGMRFGSRFYDLGSLLCDPYVRLHQSQRLELLLFYYQLGTNQPDLSCFHATFWEASAQRLMQALGAYGFLGLAKGLVRYLTHIPSGISNLIVAAENSHSLPHLLELSQRCENKIRNLTFAIDDE